MPSVHVSLFIIDVPVYIVQAVFEGFTSDSMTTTRYQSTVNSRNNMTTTTTTTKNNRSAFVSDRTTVRPSARTDLPTSPRTEHRRHGSRGGDNTIILSTFLVDNIITLFGFAAFTDRSKVVMIYCHTTL